MRDLTQILNRASLTGGASLVVILAAAAAYVLAPSPQLSIWLDGPDNITSFVGLAVLTMLASYALNHWPVGGNRAFALLPPLALAAIFAGLGVLAGLILQLGSAFLLGLLLLTRFRTSLANQPLQPGDGILALSVGLALQSGMLWALTHFPVNTRASHILLHAATGLIALWLMAPHVRAGLAALPKALLPSLQSRLPWLAAPALVIVFTLTGLAALPELGADSTAAYAAYFEHLQAHLHWHHNPALAAWGLQPLGGLHLAGSQFLISGEQGPRFFNLACLIVYVLAAGQMGRLIAGSRLGFWAAAALAGTAPLLLKLTGDFYYDNVVTLFMTSAVLAWASSLKDRSSAQSAVYILAFALCLSGASATKHTAWIMTVTLGTAAAVSFFACHDRPVRSLLTLILSGVAGMAVLVLPLVIVAYLKSGNPVFPYYNQIFESPFYAFEQHFTPHQGYHDWDMLLAAIFDTRRFSPLDLRGAAGLGLVFILPALIGGVLTPGLRRWAFILSVLTLTWVLLSLMQNDLRLLWTVMASLYALSAAIVIAASQTRTPSRRLAQASIWVAVMGQLALLPTGGVALTRPHLGQALFPDQAHRLQAEHAPIALINRMLDNWPGGVDRRLFLSTQIGPSAATNFEDGWYTFRTRQDLYRADSEETVLATLQSLAPDAIVMGTHRRRGWLNVSYYDILRAHAETVLDYDNHLVFLMDNSIAYPVESMGDRTTADFIAQSREDSRLQDEDRLDFTFPVPAGDMEAFRVSFDASCPADSTFQIHIALRRGADTVDEKRTFQPCQGEEDAAALPVAQSFDLPDDQEGLRVTLFLRIQGEYTPFSIGDMDAGFKPRLTDEALREM
ncbi:hypothetical protein [Oceanicaulis sp. MMSF_3324]|uniref:hypothetical protein n=1 Tax=Oceanicaulis sp. MMSF_3324 TaxID=3046702 RepID=UPI00273E8168|nr:hypothetical protein [Oceanicaulis sp. MMSF_3324]